MLDTIEIPPSRWVIVTCTTGFSWREAWSLIVESPSILTKKILFCPATGGPGPSGPPCLREYGEGSNAQHALGLRINAVTILFV